tara:strand:+ start:663 stop:1085 length:423 start_codon:yes stop_codon:yes gene_type:complete
MKPKKKFSETQVGKFLSKVAPHIFEVTSAIIPNSKVLNLIKGLITNDKILSPKDKQRALKLLDFDIIEMQEVTKRWTSDMISDSWLSKNVRPITLVFFSVSYVIGWFLQYPLDNITGLLSLIVGAYFGSRGLEKIKALTK